MERTTPYRGLGLGPLVLAAALVIGGLATGGCLGGTTLQRLATPTPIAVLVTLEAADGRMLAPPAALTDGLAGALAERNLTSVPIEAEQLRARFKTLRTTEQRLAALAEAAPSADTVLLIEVQATFFSQLSGRYRWEVDARTSIARRVALASPLRSDAGVAAFMQYEHEREEAALGFTRKQVLDDALHLVDRFFAADRAAEPHPAHAEDNPAKTAARPGHVDSVYFVMLDRFANGDAANDLAGGGDLAGEVGTGPASWHGGDFQGLAAHVDWLAALGVGTVWISPPFLGQAANVHGHGAFHGYWVHDLGTIAPRFGGAPAFVAATRALAERHIGVWLDLVLNHVGYDAPLVAAHPDWFHPREDIHDWNDPVQLEQNAVHGLPDLATEKPAVFGYVLEKTLALIDQFGLTGLRLDAVKHVGLDFWRRFNRAVIAHAGPGFELVGEVFDGDPLVLARYARDGEFTGLFDFPMHYALVDVVCRAAAPGAIAAVLGFDRLYPPDLAHVTFLDNHDLPRIASACGGDLAKVALGIDVMTALRGRPCLTWGTEVGLLGAGEPDNRGDMRFDAASPLVAVTRTALARRQALPALAEGATRIEALSDDLLVWARWLPGAGRSPAVLAVLNIAGEPRQVAVPSWLGAGELTAAPHALTTQVFAAAGEPPVDPKVVRVTFTTDVVDSGPRAVIGGAPELGHWQKGLALGADGAAVDLPAGTVVAWKLVAGAPPGRFATAVPNVDSGNIATPSLVPVAWEPRANRYLFVPHGIDRMTVHARWGV